MNCYDCNKEYPADKLIIQITIFLTEELYCKKCYDKLTEVKECV